MKFLATTPAPWSIILCDNTSFLRVLQQEIDRTGNFSSRSSCLITLSMIWLGGTTVVHISWYMYYHRGAST
ncbi:hypothetical protein BDN67DRAFT_337162 [Paxillus ammoniavirescens]|nr:hypothetical protein BDN67DRAFT_337162 [Paxillus ammoniavirescens]